MEPDDAEPDGPSDPEHRDELSPEAPETGLPPVARPDLPGDGGLRFNPLTPYVFAAPAGDPEAGPGPTLHVELTVRDDGCRWGEPTVGGAPASEGPTHVD